MKKITIDDITESFETEDGDMLPVVGLKDAAEIFYELAGYKVGERAIASAAGNLGAFAPVGRSKAFAPDDLIEVFFDLDPDLFELPADGDSAEDETPRPRPPRPAPRDGAHADEAALGRAPTHRRFVAERIAQRHVSPIQTLPRSACEERRPKRDYRDVIAAAQEARGARHAPVLYADAPPKQKRGRR